MRCAIARPLPSNSLISLLRMLDEPVVCLLDNGGSVWCLEVNLVLRYLPRWLCRSAVTHY